MHFPKSKSLFVKLCVFLLKLFLKLCFNGFFPMLLCLFEAFIFTEPVYHEWGSGEDSVTSTWPVSRLVGLFSRVKLAGVPSDVILIKIN